MLNTYSVVFTGGRNTCINTRVHSDPPRQPAAETEYSPLLLPLRARVLERGYSGAGAGAGAGASAGAGACI